MTLIEWFITGCFAICAGFAINYATNERWVLAYWFGFFAWTIFGVGALVFGLRNLKAETPKEDSTQAAIERLTEQNERLARPWVAFDLIGIAGPLEFNRGEWTAGPEHWHINLLGRITNTGKTPAVDVVITSFMVPLGWRITYEGDRKIGSDLLDLPSLLDRASFVPDTLRGQMGDALSTSQTKNVALTVIGDTKAFTEIVTPQQRYAGQFVVVVGISYERIGHPKDDARYQTAQAFILHRTQGNQEIPLTSVPSIPATELKLDAYPLRGNKTT